MDDLPELPFEKVLSYLSLEDRLKARAVSRRWYHQINRFKVNTLCYSQRPAGFIMGKRRLVSGAFAQNFICSTQFQSFFATFGPSIPSNDPAQRSRPTIFLNLKHLRLCDLRPNKKNLPAFVSTLQSFGQLEELDIIRFGIDPHLYGVEEIELTLPMLTSIWLDHVNGIKKLILDAPKLQKIKFVDNFYSLELVHPESVERFMADGLATIAVKDMKNLKVLYVGPGHPEPFEFDPALLSSLEQLKEIHLDFPSHSILDELFKQKRRHGRTDLKIYLRGLRLNGPWNPAIESLLNSDEEFLRCLAEKPSRLADEIPFSVRLVYSAIERFAPRREMSLVKRFTDLTQIIVDAPVEDTERFLDLLKNLDIQFLYFGCDQPQDLFDRLPEHCTAQELTIVRAPSDIRFLFRLQHLMDLSVSFSMDAEAIRKVLENEFLSHFHFKYLNKKVEIRIEHPKQFEIWVDGAWGEMPDLDAAIQFITVDSQPSKRKAEHLLE